MSVMRDNRSDMDRAFDSITSRIVTPILKHRDDICRSEGWTGEMRMALVTNQVIGEVRAIAKRELAAIHFGMCKELTDCEELTDHD